MELYLFLMLTALITLAIAWDGGLSGGAVQFLPFAFLLLLLYRPVREWGRHYPLSLQGRARWKSHAALVDRITSVTRPARPLTTAGDSLVIRDVDFSYAENSDRSGKVFSDLNLEIDTRLPVLLSGPNGAGKTTLLRLLAGIEIPGRGVIRYPELLVENEGLLLCYLPQRPVLDAEMMTELRSFLADNPENGKTLIRLLRLAPLLEKMEGDERDDGHGSLFPGHRLSGGERQRLRLAWAFTSRRPWLLLDEPTTGLPGGERDSVFSGLLEFRRNLCPDSHGVLVVSHEPGIAALCSQTVYLRGLPKKEAA